MITFLYHLFANYLVTQYFSVTKILIGLWNTFIDNIFTRNIIDAMLSSVFVVIKYYLNEISLKVSSIFSYHFRWLMHFCSWLSSKKHPDTSCKGHFTPELPDLMPELSRMPILWIWYQQYKKRSQQQNNYTFHHIVCRRSSSSGYWFLQWIEFKTFKNIYLFSWWNFWERIITF